MSINNLPYTPQVNFQNIFLDGNVIPGRSGKLLLGNQDLSGFDTPTDLYIMETSSPDDPQFPDALLISYQSSTPSPAVPVIAMSGISGQGSGPAVEVLGDLLVTGTLLPNGPINFPDLSAGTAVIDSSSNLISQPILGGKLNSNWLSDNQFGGGFIAQTGTDNSYAVIDPFNREVRLYINATWKVGQGQGINDPMNITINSTNNYTQATGTLPAPNDVFQGYLASNIAQFYFNNLNLINNSAGPFTFIGGNIQFESYNATNGAFTITSTDNCSLSSGDELILSGFISYPY